MYTVSVQGASPKELAVNLLALAAILSAPAGPAPTPVADKPKAEDKPKAADKPKVEDKPKAEKPKPVEKPKAEEKPKADALDLGQLRDLGKAAIKAGKNAEMRALLGKLGSESITALDEDKYADFKSGIEAIIAGEEPEASDEDSAL
jgi:hypothetical protein